LDTSKSMAFWSQLKTKKELLEEVFYSLAMSAYINNDNIWAFIFDENNFDFIEQKKSKENIFRIFQKMEGESNNKTINKSWSFLIPPLRTSGGLYGHPFGKGRNSTSLNSDKTQSFSLFQREYPKGEGLDNSKIEEILNLIYKRNIKNNLIFILTDDCEIKNDKLLKLIWRENEIIYINIFDIIENDLTSLWGLFSFATWKQFLNIDLSNTKKTEVYKKNINSKFKSLKEFFRKNNVGYINLNTDSDLFKELLLYFYKVKN
jgi:hypothetical protein